MVKLLIVLLVNAVFVWFVLRLAFTTKQPWTRKGMIGIAVVGIPISLVSVLLLLSEGHALILWGHFV